MIDAQTALNRQALNDAAREDGRPIPYPRLQDLNKTLYFAGLDLGKLHSRSALSVLSTETGTKPPIYRLGMVKEWRQGAGYLKVARDVAALYERYPEYKGMALAVDATGIGVSFTELLDQYNLNYIAVSITSGEREHFNFDSAVSVPKQQLIIQVAIAFEQERIKIHRKLGAYVKLHRQFKNFESELSDTGKQTFKSRKGRDDILLSLCLAFHCVRIGSVQIFL